TEQTMLGQAIASPWRDEVTQAKRHGGFGELKFWRVDSAHARLVPGTRIFTDLKEKKRQSRRGGLNGAPEITDFSGRGRIDQRTNRIREDAAKRFRYGSDDTEIWHVICPLTAVCLAPHNR